MTIKHWLFGLAAGSILLTNCASTDVSDIGDINQDKIHMYYKVEINKDMGIAEAEAQFRFGGNTGTTLLLSGDADVTINGDDMDGDDEFLRGEVYSTRIKEADGYTFVFKDYNGKAYTNSMQLEPIDLDDVPDQVSGQQGITVSWEGAPVGPNQTVTLYLRGEESALGMPIGRTDIQGDRTIKVDPREVRDYVNGDGELYIIRRVDMPVTEAADEGGQIVGTYHSSSYHTTIVGATTQQQYDQEMEELDAELEDLEKELDAVIEEIESETL